MIILIKNYTRITQIVIILHEIRKHARFNGMNSHTVTETAVYLLYLFINTDLPIGQTTIAKII